MKLLHAEVDVMPGTDPRLQNVGPGVRKNAAMAEIQLVNESASINSFRVWVPTDEADGWVNRAYKISRLDQQAVGQINDQTVNGRYQANAEPNKARRLAISFPLAKQAESRAGVYSLSVEIESTVPVGPKQVRRVSVPITVVVRPYAEWSAKLETFEKGFGLFRRRRDYNLVVENKGNDWLYLDFNVPEDSKALRVRLDAERIAVPPAASSQRPSRREILVRVYHKGKGMVGAPVRTPFPISLARVDAPSVTRFPEVEGEAVVTNLQLGMPVLPQTTQESKIASGAEAVYRPPIPRSIPDFFNAIRQNFMLLLGIFLMAVMSFYAMGFLLSRFDNTRKLSVDAHGTLEQGGEVPQGQKVTVTFKGGRLAEGAIQTGGDVAIENPPGKAASLKLFHVSPVAENQFSLVVPSGATGEVEIVVKYTLFGRTLPFWSDSTFSFKVKESKAEQFNVVPPDTYTPEGDMNIRYHGTPGKIEVYIGSVQVHPVVGNGAITFRFPDVKDASPTLHVFNDGTEICTKPLTNSAAIVDPNKQAQPGAETGTASSAGIGGQSPTAGGGGGASAGASGGGVAGGSAPDGAPASGATGFQPFPGYPDMLKALKSGQPALILSACDKLGNDSLSLYMKATGRVLGGDHSGAIHDLRNQADEADAPPGDEGYAGAFSYLASAADAVAKQDAATARKDSQLAMNASKLHPDCEMLKVAADLLSKVAKSQ